MPQVTLKEECDIILMVKNPDGTTSEQYLWTAAKGEVLKLNPVRECQP
jgi:hypothetical protein